MRSEKCTSVRSPGPSTEFMFDLVVCPLPGVIYDVVLCDYFSQINTNKQGYLHNSLSVSSCRSDSRQYSLLATDPKTNFLFPL